MSASGRLTVRAVPYPLPPLLTGEGLCATIANVRECQQQLPVPLVIEFPGFSLGASVVAGSMHAYDFFRALAEETSAPVTLDVGHLLSWQWWRGRRGEALLGELDRLPLENCFEIHLSGCEIAGEAFIDAHHGRLLDEQLKLTQLLMECCPNLRAITYEDPRFDDDGALVASNRPSWERLQQLVAGWEGAGDEPRAQTVAQRPCARPDPAWGTRVEAALGDYLFGAASELSIDGLPSQGEAEAVIAVRKMVLERRYRGTGGLREWYPKTIAAWIEQHPDDAGLELLVAQFCASGAGTLWREYPNARRGLSLEEALYRFFETEGVGDAAVREDEMLGAVVRTLAVTPRGGFVWPDQVRATKAGCVALSSELVLHAVTTGRYVRGSVTPLIAALLRGDDVAGVAAHFGVPVGEVDVVRDQLHQQGFLSVA
ncbi:MAG: multinuclear nonheme iron-dependent oxidase [Myxococcaceae bacterium]